MNTEQDVWRVVNSLRAVGVEAGSAEMMITLPSGKVDLLSSAITGGEVSSAVDSLMALEITKALTRGPKLDFTETNLTMYGANKGVITQGNNVLVSQKTAGNFVQQYGNVNGQFVYSNGTIGITNAPAIIGGTTNSSVTVINSVTRVSSSIPIISSNPVERILGMVNGGASTLPMVLKPTTSPGMTQIVTGMGYRVEDVVKLTSAENKITPLGQSLLNDIYSKSMDLKAGDMMSKVVNPENLPNYLNGKYNSIYGSTTKLDYTTELKTGSEIMSGLRMDYPGTFMGYNAPIVTLRINYPVVNPSTYQLYTKENVPNLSYPNTGRMWTGSNTGLIPEVMANGDILSNGAQMMLENSVTGAKLKEWEYNLEDRRWEEK